MKTIISLFILGIILYSPSLRCQINKQAIQKIESLQDEKKQIVLNQMMRIEYDDYIFKYANSISLELTASPNNLNQTEQSFYDILEPCEEIQRTIDNREGEFTQFKSSQLGLTSSDKFIGFGQVQGGTYFGVTKQGKISILKLQMDNYALNSTLSFVSTLNLRNDEITEMPGFYKYKENSILIVMNDQLVDLNLLTFKTKSIPFPKDLFVNGQKMIITKEDDDSPNLTLFVPSNEEKLVKLSIEIKSNGISLNKHEIIHTIGEIQLENVKHLIFSQEQQLVYILDSFKGLILSNKQLSQTVLQINQVKDGYSFDIYQNSKSQQTSIIILKKGASIPEGMEVYLDNSEPTIKYQIGRTIRLHEANWNRVIAFDHFCLFQGKQSHVLEYHSTFNNFNKIPNLLTSHSILAMYALSPSSFIEENNQLLDQTSDKFLVIALSNDGYSFNLLTPLAPKIECLPIIKEQIGTFEYKVTINSNMCPSTDKSSIWLDCKINQNVELDVTRVLVDDSNSVLVAVIVLGSVLLLVLIAGFTYNLVRKHKGKISGLEREIQTLTSQIKKPSSNIKYMNMKDEEQQD